MKTVIRTYDQLVDWCSNHHGVVAYDTETTSLKYLDLELLGISISDGVDTCYIVWQDDPRWVSYLSVYFTECVTLLIGHNLPYDMKVLYKYGIDHTDKVYCTMTGAHVCNENGTKKLKELAMSVLGVPASEIQSWEVASAKGTDSDEFYDYAMNDALWTYRLWEVQRKQLRRQELEYLMYSIECPFQFALRDLEINGVEVSASKVQELLDIVEPKRAELYRAMYDAGNVGYSMQHNMFGPSELISNINLNNNQRCAEIIQRLGFKITEQTAGGQPSADKYTLKRLAGQHPFIDSLAEYRVLDTLYNNFLKNAISRIETDGRTRASVNNTVAVTGRLSYNKPNFQNMPRPGTCPVEFREVVIAKPGYKLVAADYSGQELRVLAHVSKDKGMINAFLNNQDLHLAMANKFYRLGIPEECLVTSHPDYEKYKSQFKKERIDAKIINFGIAYGKSPVGFANDFKIPVPEAEKIVESYFAAAPGVRKAIDDCHRKLYRCKYATTIAGRRRRFDIINNRAKRQAFNHMIQGSSADMVKLAMGGMVKLFAAYPEWDAKLAITVHDEVVAECKEDYAECVRDGMVEIMENCMTLAVPLVVDADIGDTYAEAK